ISQTVRVSVPVRVAYNQWTQFEDFPFIMRDIHSVQQTDDRHLRWRGQWGGCDVEWDSEIIEQVPDNLIEWRSQGGPEQGGLVQFTPLSAEETEVLLCIEYRGEGDERQERGARRYTALELEDFKRFIEHRGRETGAWRGEIPPSGMSRD
ncbi:MAG TPA: SRPBCC family protein, partial [Acidiferrobacteraceae bacterium]|nr:SRPBCC family protein [Acidiferrobacteraceae bacterium]